jgi:hypothetical protein
MKPYSSPGGRKARWKWFGIRRPYPPLVNTAMKGWDRVEIEEFAHE